MFQSIATQKASDTPHTRQPRGFPDFIGGYRHLTVASEAGNLRSEFGHARPSGSPVIRYVRNGTTDGQKPRLTVRLCMGVFFVQVVANYPFVVKR